VCVCVCADQCSVRHFSCKLDCALFYSTSKHAGGALQEAYGVTACMRGADVNVRVDVVGPMIVIATQLNEAELSRRHKQVRTTNLITTLKQLSLHISFLCVFDQSRA
jgi:hypothetical protein